MAIRDEHCVSRHGVLPTGEEDKVVVYDPLGRKLWVDTKDNVLSKDC
jgi:hypothetical protein